MGQKNGPPLHNIYLGVLGSNAGKGMIEELLLVYLWGLPVILPVYADVASAEGYSISLSFLCITSYLCMSKESTLIDWSGNET